MRATEEPGRPQSSIEPCGGFGQRYGSCGAGATLGPDLSIRLSERLRLAASTDALTGGVYVTGYSQGNFTGIANQRETTLLWDRRTGEPVHRAIVWQDRRTADRCEQLAAAGHLADVRRVTGLVLDPYFSGTKAAWLLQHRDIPADGLAIGTIDSWLVARLTEENFTSLQAPPPRFLQEADLLHQREEPLEHHVADIDDLRHVVVGDELVELLAGHGGDQLPVLSDQSKT